MSNDYTEQDVRDVIEELRQNVRPKGVLEKLNFVIYLNVLISESEDSFSKKIMNTDKVFDVLVPDFNFNFQWTTSVDALDNALSRAIHKRRMLLFSDKSYSCMNVYRKSKFYTIEEIDNFYKVYSGKDPSLYTRLNFISSVPVNFNFIFSIPATDIESPDAYDSFISIVERYNKEREK